MPFKNMYPKSKKDFHGLGPYVAIKMSLSDHTMVHRNLYFCLPFFNISIKKNENVFF